MKNRIQITIAILIFLIPGGVVLQLKAEDSLSPNILLITVDSLRPDHLGCYGYPKNTSPNIDQLAKEGVIFTQAIAQASWTWPSIHSLITSTYPFTHKVYFYDKSLPNAALTLPYILGNKSYRTGFISGHGGLSSFNRGFGEFEDISAKGEEITQEAMRWIKSGRNKKFFLWIHYMDTHENSIGVSKEKDSIKKITVEMLRSYISRYDSAISYIDSQVGILFEELNKLGLYENTVIIFTADHGEEMGENGLHFNHGGFLWDSVIRVPLIISFPKNLPKSRVISQQVQHVDLFPTVCDILKIKKLGSFEGNSLLPLIKRVKLNSPYAFSEHIQTDGDFLSTDKWLLTQISLRTVNWKLMLNLKNDSLKYELYNLKNDPQESNNVIEFEKERFKFLKAKLEEWINRPKPKITPLIKPPDEQTKERLKSLGYLH